MCDRFGYEWEPHVAETEDGWFLTVFRITAVKGKALPEDPTKPPILVMHGAGQASHDWLGFNPLGPTLIGQLAERGYDVWAGNNRGTLYSNVNRNDDTWTLEQHWDFTWAEEGIYDVPALVEKMIETTGHPKVTMMGYSTGGAQMFYGLAKKQDWFAERVNRFVALSACHYMRMDVTYEEEVSYYAALDSLGVYNFWGKDDSTLSSETCSQVGRAACGFVGFAPPYDGQALPVKSFMYYTQIALEGRFQEP